jgi:predicted exporter
VLYFRLSTVHSLVTAIVAIAYRRRWIVAAAVLVVVGVSLVGARRVSFDADVLSLLPRDGRVIPAFRRYLSRFGSVDQLYVVFTAPEGHAVSEYADEIDDWVDRLRHTPEISQVDAGIPDGGRNYAWLAERQLLLLGEPAVDAALARLSPDGMVSALAARRELLALPSTQMADLVRQDPVGLTDMIAESLGSAVPGLSARAATRGYVSDDGRRRLVTAQPIRPPYDSAFSRALDARLQQLGAEVRHGDAARAADRDEVLPPLRVEFAGGHRIALETEAVVRRESILNTVGSLALILPLLFFAFRSLWLVLVGSLPSGLSLLVVLGILGFTGSTLSAAAAGSAAMLFGLGVDGVVLLYVAHRHEADRGTTSEAMPAALSGPSSSMLLGMWTTAATFYGLVFVDFPSLQQLGLLVGHSMMACGILTLVLVPALLPKRVRAGRRRQLTAPRLATWVGRHRRWILGGAAIATLALGAAASGLRVNPTLDRLRAVTPAAQLESTIAPIFGLPSEVYIGLAEGQDLELLLQTHERLSERVARDLPGVGIQPPTKLMPSQASQDRTARRIRTAQLSVEAVRASLDHAADAAGFRSGTFQAFSDRLPRLLDSTDRLSYDGYETNGLGDLARRFVVREGTGWLAAAYFFPKDRTQIDRLEALMRDIDPSLTLTGLPLVNRELGRRFLPQFGQGLAIGTAIVVLLVGLAFRDWRLSMCALVPTVIGLVWAAGLLALAKVELDLFAVFAVVTFIGVGVDYGIHLVHRFQERGDAALAVAELAPVILVAAAITLLGYGTLLDSTYPPLRSIGVVSAVSVLTLSVASVLVLPALLISSGE